jgi:hypothetical protein
MIAALLAAALAAQGPALPPEVRRFVERRMECDHWTGEEAYDKARGREIEANIRDLRCDRIDRDDQRLVKRYSGRTEVLEALRIAREGV